MATRRSLFRVRGVPAAKGSLRAFKNRKTGQPIITEGRSSRQKDWQAAVGHVLQSEWEGPPLEGAVDVALLFSFLRPASAPRARHWPSVKPDIDKLARAVLDAMTGIVFRDDAQVVRLRVDKIYHEEAGVVIDVESTDGEPAAAEQSEKGAS